MKNIIDIIIILIFIYLIYTTIHEGNIYNNKSSNIRDSNNNTVNDVTISDESETIDQNNSVNNLDESHIINQNCDGKKYDWRLHKPDDTTVAPTIKQLYDNSIKDYKKMIPKNNPNSKLKTQNNYTMNSGTSKSWSYVDDNNINDNKITENIYAFDAYYDPYSSIYEDNNDHK